MQNTTEEMIAQQQLFGDVVTGQKRMKPANKRSQLWCKDMWYAGLGRIAVVPSVNLGYEDADTKRIKKTKGYVYQAVQRENDEGSEDNLISWQDHPPDQVKCVVNWGDQYWSPWNETLPIDGYPKARILGADNRLGSW